MTTARRDGTPRRGPRSFEKVAASYLGFRLLIGDVDVEVTAPDGHRLPSVRSVKQARLMVRGYRRAERQTA